MEQFTYTGSPWGYTAPGWTVLQRTKGFNPRNAEKYQRYFQFHRPADAAGGFSPVQFVYAWNAQGGLVASQTVDAGLRWFDKSRGRDYFAHVAVAAGDEADIFPPGFNPLALYMSETFETAFPEALRKKAEDILAGVAPNAPTPPLEKPETFAGFVPNPALSGDAPFRSLSKGAAGKLFGLARILAEKAAGAGGTLFFDATSPAAIPALAAALSILPEALRRKVSFSTWLPQQAVSGFPAGAPLLFCGTVVPNAAPDPDTGVYCELREDPENGFADVDEAIGFKRMADACGMSIGAGDFARLAGCWNVARGRDRSRDAVSDAVALCEKCRGVEELLRSRGETAFLDAHRTRKGYIDALELVSSCRDLERFFKTLHGLPLKGEAFREAMKGVDMAKDLVARFTTSMTREDVLVAIEQFRKENIPDSEIIAKALEAAEHRGAMDARSQMARTPAPAYVAHAGSGRGRRGGDNGMITFMQVAISFATGLVFGVVLYWFMSSVLKTDDPAAGKPAPGADVNTPSHIVGDPVTDVQKTPVDTTYVPSAAVPDAGQAAGANGLGYAADGAPDVDGAANKSTAATQTAAMAPSGIANGVPDTARTAAAGYSTNGVQAATQTPAMIAADATSAVPMQTASAGGTTERAEDSKDGKKPDAGEKKQEQKDGKQEAGKSGEASPDGVKSKEEETDAKAKGGPQRKEGAK